MGPAPENALRATIGRQAFAIVRGAHLGSSRQGFDARPTGNAMKRTWTIIGVSDVAASIQWYQSLFGQPATPPGHDHFCQLLDTDGTVLLCLHQWGAHEHPSLMSPDTAPPGNGLLLFFRVDDYDKALKRARALVARLEEEPHVNPNTRTAEFSLRDPDGYYVTISALSAPGEEEREAAA
jgi:catechol 2,3-dioxygenase-like lactoylglutathione lyase family enzyme